MKNNPTALDKILAGKLVYPLRGDHIYITADITKPEEYIYIPTNKYTLPSVFDKLSRKLFIPGDNDTPVLKECVVFNNDKEYKKREFIWVEGANTWAYYSSDDRHIS